MTERQWLASVDPKAMIAYLETHLQYDEESARNVFHIPEVRKLRLFGVACCRRVEHLLTDRRSRDALDVMERYLDRRATKRQYDRVLAACAKVTWELEEAPGCFRHAANAACSALEDIQDDFQDVAEVAGQAVEAVVAPLPEGVSMRRWKKVARAEQQAQAALLRDIFGNPFRPVALDPAWLSSDALALARGIYDDGAFDRMPILADALQDAGCDNADVLAHCRDPNAAHVRGCWVIDLLLGKG